MNTAHAIAITFKPDWDGICSVSGNPLCKQCLGKGKKFDRRTAVSVRDGKKWIVQSSVSRPCKCALRNVFSRALAYFRYAENEIGAVTLDFATERRGTSSGGGQGNWGRKPLEFRADFCGAARQSLDEFHQRVFRLHFLLGGNYVLCCKKLGCDRGEFFHAVYRLMSLVGERLVENGVWPLCAYHAGSSRLDHKLPATFQNAVHGTRTGIAGAR